MGLRFEVLGLMLEVGGLSANATDTTTSFRRPKPSSSSRQVYLAVCLVGDHGGEPRKTRTREHQQCFRGLSMGQGTETAPPSIGWRAGRRCGGRHAVVPWAADNERGSSSTQVRPPKRADLQPCGASAGLGGGSAAGGRRGHQWPPANGSTSSPSSSWTRRAT